MIRRQNEVGRARVLLGGEHVFVVADQRVNLLTVLQAQGNRVLDLEVNSLSENLQRATHLRRHPVGTVDDVVVHQ